jgi:CRISPR/Cas system-associated exonuclease Cas4 (RecB family)
LRRARDNLENGAMRRRAGTSGARFRLPPHAAPLAVVGFRNGQFGGSPPTLTDHRDFLHIRKNEIHEVKKSSSKPAIDRIQAGFYLLWLNRRGIPITRAILRYPLEKKTRTVEWEPSLELQVKAHIRAVSTLVKQEQPPKAAKISACYKCAYRELCFE